MVTPDAIIPVGADTTPLVRDISSALRKIQQSSLTRLNVRNIAEPLGRISGLASEFEKSLEAANARVLAFGASAGILFQVVRAFRETVSATIQVEKSLKDINVILNASESQLSRFGNQLFKVAANTGQTFDTVAQAAAELSRQGLTLQETQKRVQDALILSRLSGLDALNAVESLTAALNTFNQVGLDSTAVINKLANVDAAFAVSSADLAESLKRTGNTAKDAQVSFDELLGIVAAVQERTARGGAVIGNALRTIFVRTQRPQTLDDLEELGIQARESGNKTRPLLPILQQLADRFSSLSDAQQSNIVQQVAGVRQGEILRALLADLSSGYSNVAEGAQIAANSTDQANKRNEELNKTLSAQTNRLLANLTKVGSAVGSLSLGPLLEGGVGFLNKILELDESTNQLVNTGLAFGEAILEGLGKALVGPGAGILAVFAKNLFVDFARFVTTAVSEIGKLNQAARTQNAIQRSIASVLSSQPELLTQISRGERTVESVARETLSLYESQRLVLQQINTISASIARNTIAGAGGAGAFDQTAVRRGTATLRTRGVLGAANGNPRIFRSLSGAINNEIKGGVPRTAIRLNSSRALSTRTNPTGLAVTNVRDEPQGLRSIGIPNFVDPLRLVTTKGTVGGQLKLNRSELTEFTKALNLLQNEGTKLGDVFSKIRESVRSKKGSTSVFDDLVSSASIRSGAGRRDIVDPIKLNRAETAKLGKVDVDRNLLPAVRQNFLPVLRSDLEKLNQETAKSISQVISQSADRQELKNKVDPKTGKEPTINREPTTNTRRPTDIRVGVPITPPAIVDKNTDNLFKAVNSLSKQIEENELASRRAATVGTSRVGGFAREDIRGFTADRGGRLLLPEASESTLAQRQRQEALKGRLFERQRQRDLAKSLRLNVFDEALPTRSDRAKEFFTKKRNVSLRGGRLERLGNKVGGTQGTFALFGASAIANSIAGANPDSRFAQGASNVINNTATAAIFGSLINPVAGAIAGLSTLVISLSKEFGLLDSATKGLVDSFKNFFGSYDTGELDVERDKVLEDIRDLFKTEFITTTTTLPNNRITNAIPFGAGGPGGAPSSFNNTGRVETTTAVTTLTDPRKFSQFLSSSLSGDSVEELSKSLVSFNAIVSNSLFGDKASIEKAIIRFSQGIEDPAQRRNFNAAFTALPENELKGIFGNQSLKELFTEDILKEIDKIKEALKGKNNLEIDLINQQVSLLESRLNSVNQISQINRAGNIRNAQFRGGQERFGLETSLRSLLLTPLEEIGFRSQRESQQIRDRQRNEQANINDTFLKANFQLFDDLESFFASSANAKTASVVTTRIAASELSGPDTLREVLSDKNIELEEKEREKLVDTLTKLQSLENDKLEATEKILTETEESLKTLERNRELQEKEIKLRFERERLLDRANANLKLIDSRRQFSRNAESIESLTSSRREDLNARIASRGLVPNDFNEGINNALNESFQRNDLDVFNQVVGTVDELAKTLKSGLTTALTDTILQAKSASEAFGGLADAIARIALQRSLETLFDSALSRAGSAFGNGRQGFMSGGLVQGGSGFRDDVPANLNSGEFVLRRSAVNRIGVGNLNQLNQQSFLGLQDGGFARVNLNNSTQFLGNPRRPSGFRINIDPSLSAFALSSDINRQNQVREERTQQAISYRQQQQQLLDQFRKQQQGRRLGALITLVSSAAGAALNNPNSGIGGSDFSGTGPQQATNKGFTASRSGILRNSGSAFNQGGVVGLERGGIPAILTGGEFRVNRDLASSIGMDALGRLNSGQISSFQGGGATSSIPSQENPTERVVDAIKELQSVLEKNNPATTSQGGQQQNNQSRLAPSINIDIPITIQGGSSSDLSTTRSTEEIDLQEDSNRDQDLQQFQNTMRAMIQTEIEKQSRPGGQLYSIVKNS